ncbi:lymphatic vessel endothelial hyaluronic acid receptor 1a isoform X1 [Brachyistius frenatus]|uniref:lymphatic vessel endothelial hyaluronic acid receptor 1a isoform X1 n=1 Tax=Brachyistius frenatus TaxID=100188 RepID=UPI0037E9AEC2
MSTVQAQELFYLYQHGKVQFTVLNLKLFHMLFPVFPAVNESVAGVFQVSYLNDLNQPQYAFNASEARSLCSFLGVHIASKAQVEVALTRGLETCRFGWIDEHFAVIPRIQALSNCGQNQTGLVTWRASVRQKFDVFCISESDAATQLEDTANDSPLSSGYSTGHPPPPSQTTESSSSTDETVVTEAGPARFVGSAEGSAGGKTVLITCTCALLLTATIILAYLKLRKRCLKQEDEYIQTEEWTVVKTIQETKKAVQEDERIEEGDSAH